LGNLTLDERGSQFVTRFIAYTQRGRGKGSTWKSVQLAGNLCRFMCVCSLKAHHTHSWIRVHIHSIRKLAFKWS